MTTRLLSSAAFCLLVACQANAPDVAGHYVGTLQAGGGSAKVVVDLNDVNGALSGTASGSGLTFQVLPYYVTGSKQDGSVEFTISAGYDTGSEALALGGICRYRLVGTFEGGSLHGNFSTNLCQDNVSGTFTFQRS